MEKKKILILMSRVGGGHVAVATALEQAFSERGHEVVFFEALPKVIIPLYGIISRYFLSFWGFLFWTSNEERAAKIIAQLSNTITKNKIAQKIKKEVPDFIISDHPFITRVDERVFASNGHVPLGVVVVDPVTVHSIWFKGKPDVYFVPTDYVRQLAQEAGVAENKIVYSGYPVRKEFSEPVEIKSLRRYLGLEAEVFTILIGGSAEGVGKIEDLCDYLASLSERYRFSAIVVCGRNKSLFRKLASRYYYDCRFKILGFERHMEDYIRACDVVVSKAGPTNLYESLAARKPFLAFGCMPGQEEGNLEMIKREKIGLVEAEIEKVFIILKRWIKEPKLLKVFTPGIEIVGKQQREASERIVKYVEGFGNGERLR